MARPEKDKYYLDIALAVGKRSPCTRRKFGSIIVKNDAIISTGYNGPPRGSTNCEEGCLKDEKNAESYGKYDLCPAIHSEENAVINAARHGTQIKDGKLYIIGVDPETEEKTESKPCDRCKRVLTNVGITEVITQDEDEEIIRYYPKHWAEKEKKEYKEKVREAREE